MNKKAVVLLSGGIDSTTCLATAVKEHGAENVLALNAIYGQKHIKEVKAAWDVAQHYNVEYMQRDLSQVFELSNCTLLRGRGNIPHASYADQADGRNPVSTYVPFRNGVLLSYAAAIALSIGAREVWYGAHADDAAGAAYPDCSKNFVWYMDHAMLEGSGWQVSLRAPFIELNKTEVVRKGLELRAPYQLTWSCYEGADKPCGKCGTCIDRAKAFEANGVVDPALVTKEA